MGSVGHAASIPPWGIGDVSRQRRDHQRRLGLGSGGGGGPRRSACAARRALTPLVATLAPPGHLGVDVAGVGDHRRPTERLEARPAHRLVELLDGLPHLTLRLIASSRSSRSASSRRTWSAGGRTPVMFSRSTNRLSHQSGSWRPSRSASGLPWPGRSSKSPRSMACRICRSTQVDCCSIFRRAAERSRARSRRPVGRTALSAGALAGVLLVLLHRSQGTTRAALGSVGDRLRDRTRPVAVPRPAADRRGRSTAPRS